MENSKRKLIATAFLFLLAGLLLWRRFGPQPGTSSFASAPEPVPMPEQASRPSPAPERIVHEDGAVPGPEVREKEHVYTDKTKYERLAELEREERRAAAERLRSDPLTERLAAES